MVGKTSTASKSKYNAKAYDRAEVVFKKGQKDLIKAHAENKGQSLNAYINALIERDMATNTDTAPDENQP